MGNPFVHVELNTSDPSKARAFYQALFDWKLSDLKMGDGLYTMIDVGKVDMGTGGGMQKNPMLGAPPAWLSYVAVDSVKRTIARAKKLGARIIVDHQDVGMGVLGIFSDPTGAILGVWEPRTAEVAPPPRQAAARAAKKPAAKKPAAKKPAAREPAAKKPAAREPAAKKPAAKRPAAKKPAARRGAAGPRRR